MQLKGEEEEGEDTSRGKEQMTVHAIQVPNSVFCLREKEREEEEGEEDTSRGKFRSKFSFLHFSGFRSVVGLSKCHI